MTVLELINELLHLPPDAEIVYDGWSGGGIEEVVLDSDSNGQYVYLSPE